MKKYRVGGDLITARDAEDLVRQMNEGSFSRMPSTEEYMLDVAERVRTQSGDKPRVDTHEHFVADLISAGMVKEV